MLYSYSPIQYQLNIVDFSGGKGWDATSTG